MSYIPNYPVLQQDLIGNVKAGPPNRMRDFVLGRHTNVDNVNVDLWDGPTGTYVFPSTPMQMEIVSSSVNDTLAGTGVQKVIIYYLDADYLAQTETISLNGTTPVTTVATDIIRINGMHGVQMGSAGFAVGDISLRHLSNTPVYCYLGNGYNTARHGIYTVPANRQGYISHFQASVGTASGSHFTRIFVAATTRNNVLYPSIFLVQDEVDLLNNSSVINYPIPIPIPPMCDVKVSAISDAAGADAYVTAGLMGWTEDL